MGSRWNEGGNFQFGNDIGRGFDSLSDGMDEKLDSAARSIYNDEIQDDEDYKFRPDMNFMPGDTYTARDLDLTKPAIPKPFKRDEFETTTDEVLKKADFRNVRFLSNFSHRCRNYNQKEPDSYQRESPAEGGEGDQDSQSIWAHAFYNNGK